MLVVNEYIYIYLYVSYIVDGIVGSSSIYLLYSIDFLLEPSLVTSG